MTSHIVTERVAHRTQRNEAPLADCHQTPNRPAGYEHVAPGSSTAFATRDTEEAFCTLDSQAQEGRTSNQASILPRPDLAHR